MHLLRISLLEEIAKKNNVISVPIIKETGIASFIVKHFDV